VTKSTTITANNIANPSYAPSNLKFPVDNYSFNSPRNNEIIAAPTNNNNIGSSNGSNKNSIIDVSLNSSF